MRIFKGLLAVLIIAAATCIRAGEIELTYDETNGWETRFGDAAHELYITHIVEDTEIGIVAALEKSRQLEKKLDFAASSKKLYRLKVVEDLGAGGMKLALANPGIKDNIITDVTEMSIDQIFLGKAFYQKCLVIIVRDTEENYAAFFVHPKRTKISQDATTGRTFFEIEAPYKETANQIQLGQINRGCLQLENIYSVRDLGTVQITNMNALPPEMQKNTPAENHR